MHRTSSYLCVGLAMALTLAGIARAEQGVGFSQLPADRQSAIRAKLETPPVAEREAPYSTPMYYLLAKGFADGPNNELLLDRNRPDWQEQVLKDWVELGLTSTHFCTTPSEWDNPDIVQAIRDYCALSAKHGLKVGIRLAGDPKLPGIEHSGWAVHPKNPENRIPEYVEWTRKVAEALKGTVEYYVVGDEVNSSGWEESDGKGGTIQGITAPEDRRWTPEAYMTVFTQISQAIKSQDTQTRVSMFGMNGLDWDYVEKLMKLGYADHADAVAANVDLRSGPANIRDFVARVRATSPDFKFYSNGVGYIAAETEASYPSNAKGYPRLDDETQARKIAQLMVSLFDTGWDRTPYYIVLRQWQLPDGRVAPHWYGFFGFEDFVVDAHENLTVKRYPAWYAFQTIAHVFHTRSACAEPEFDIKLSSPVEHVFNYVRNDRELLIVMWNEQASAQTATTLDIGTGRFRYPVSVDLYNYRKLTDLPYAVGKDNVTIADVPVGSAPVIVRLVAEE